MNDTECAAQMAVRAEADRLAGFTKDNVAALSAAQLAALNLCTDVVRLAANFAGIADAGLLSALEDRDAGFFRALEERDFTSKVHVEACRLLETLVVGLNELLAANGGRQ